jgi:hypothetical protein
MHLHTGPTILIAVTALLGGCASMFMNGGKLVENDYAPPVKASFVVPKCHMTDGTPIDGPSNIVFQLVQEPTQLAIFERSADGTGAVITNTWSDGKGDHYFGWVQAQGWEYVIPRDPSVQPVRFVYANLQVGEVGTVTKPLTPVSAICPMILQGGSPPPVGAPQQQLPPPNPAPPPAGAYPAPPPAGAYPAPPPAGAYPAPPPAGAYPQQQPAGAYPAPPPAGAYPAPPPAGAYPAPPPAGAYPQQQPPATYPR